MSSESDAPVLRAARNLQYGEGVSVEAFSVYKAVKYENLVIEKGALEHLLKRLEK